MRNAARSAARDAGFADPDPDPPAEEPEFFDWHGLHQSHLLEKARRQEVVEKEAKERNDKARADERYVEDFYRWVDEVNRESREGARERAKRLPTVWEDDDEDVEEWERKYPFVCRDIEDLADLMPNEDEYVVVTEGGPSPFKK
jgi:hypothetical protein